MPLKQNKYHTLEQIFKSSSSEKSSNFYSVKYMSFAIKTNFFVYLI